jgi:hypothetical protein
LDSFKPGKMFQKSKDQWTETDPQQRELRMVKSFIKLVNCVIPRDQELSTPELYTLAQIFTGRHKLMAWHDPAYEFVVEEEKDNMPPLAHLLPKEITDKLPFGKKKKMEKRVYRQDLVHPRIHHLIPFIKKEMESRETQDLSQISFALAAVLNQTKNQRRAQFFLA